jgi:hypothetical protein
MNNGYKANNDSASAPTFINHMCGYSNIAVSYANTSNPTELWAPDATQASGKGYHPGWVYVTRGMGPVTAVGIAAGGTGYANTDKWALATGNTQANGTISTNSTGGIVNTTITNAGAGFFTQNAALTITTSGGSGATLRATIGGRCGRISREVLVTAGQVSTANSADDYTSMP